MPVTTRSQRSSAVKFVLPKPANSYAEVAKNKFIMHMKKLVHCCEKAKGVENKMRVSLEIFKYVNKELPGVVQKTSEELWIKLAAIIFIKTLDIENQYNGLSMADKKLIDKEVLENLNAEMQKSRNFTTTLIRDNWVLSSHPKFIQAKEYISRSENVRPRRSVARVSYVGMDMNDEDDGKIHINKRRFEDGKVKYIWKSYPLSQANEIEDEDYVDEDYADDE